MEYHFNWIWNNASTGIIDYIEGVSVGSEQAIKQCGIKNIFIDEDIARNRIIHLLEHSQRVVSIQGISLNSFMSTDFRVDKLRESLAKILKDEIVDVEILLLDPESE
jgi:hypothetical protein